jgi:hypothetical protein
MNDTSKQIEVACEVKRETSSALLINDGTKDVWIPKSQISDQCEENGLFGSKVVSIFVPEWLALDKGLI